MHPLHDSLPMAKILHEGILNSSVKPSLVLYDSDKDVVVAFISSRIGKYEPETDVLINKSHPEFHVTGLKTDSVLKLLKIATLHKKLIAGKIGAIGKQLREEINQKIMEVLILWTLL